MSFFFPLKYTDTRLVSPPFSPAAMEPPTPAHLLVFPWPALGHINPALQLSLKLASSGLLITFVNTHHHISKLQAQAAHFVISGINIRLVGLPDGLPDGQGGTDDVPRLGAATEKMGGVLEQLLERLLSPGQDWPAPVCIITDVFLGWAQDVANKLKLPRYIFFTPPAACLVVMLHLQAMLADGRLPFKGEAALLNLPGITSTMRMTDLPSHLLLDPSAFMYGYFIRHSNRIRDASGILLNSFYELEKKAIDAARVELFPKTTVWPVGPLLPSNIFEGNSESNSDKISRADDSEALQWLDTQVPSSVLYVSFGSIAVLSEAQIHELALGLETSKHPFLWVVRPENPSSTIQDVLPPGFAAQTKGRGRVVSWAPQLQVLLHRSTGGFLSHCGWNSTLESICAGVPLVSWPMGAEQRMNGRFLVDEARVAMEVRKGEGGLVRAREVEGVVRRLMGGGEEAMRRRMEELREAAIRAAVANGEGDQNLLVFVQHVINNNNNKTF